VVLLLKSASAEAMAHAAVALGSAVSCHLSRALGHMAGGDGARRARNGLQEEVRQYCLQTLREQRGGGAAAAGAASGGGVPLIRHVSAAHPAEVAMEVLVHAAACEGAGGEVRRQRDARGLGDAGRMRQVALDARRPRAAVQGALLDWLLRRLGLSNARLLPPAPLGARREQDRDLQVTQMLGWQ
jgi:hypothetical protein